MTFKSNMNPSKYGNETNKRTYMHNIILYYKHSILLHVCAILVAILYISSQTL